MAADFCVQRKYEILNRNWHCSLGEVDLFAKDPSNRRYVLIEVRGRTSDRYRPVKTLSQYKIRRLKLLQRILQTKADLPVHIEFIEMIECGGQVTGRFYAIKG